MIHSNPPPAPLVNPPTAPLTTTSGRYANTTDVGSDGNDGSDSKGEKQDAGVGESWEWRESVCLQEARRTAGNNSIGCCRWEP